MESARQWGAGFDNTVERAFPESRLCENPGPVGKGGLFDAACIQFSGDWFKRIRHQWIACGSYIRYGCRFDWMKNEISHEKSVRMR
jgi:hypothetical protein